MQHADLSIFFVFWDTFTWGTSMDIYNFIPLQSLDLYFLSRNKTQESIKVILVII